MAKQDSSIKIFSTRVRQLILKYRDLKKENEELYAMVELRDKEIEALKSKAESYKNEFESLKMAKMIEVTDGDLANTKKRLSHLVREVNQCITLLSEKQ